MRSSFWAVAGRALGIVILFASSAALAERIETYNPDPAVRREARLAFHMQVLRDAGIEPTAAGVRACLQAFPIEPAGGQEWRGQVEALIVQLGDPSWQVREAATAKLLQLSDVPADMLRDAASSGDLEIAARAQHIMQARQAGVSSMEDALQRQLAAALAVIELQQIEGLADPILRVLPVLAEPYLFEAGCRALAATANDDDAETLRPWLSGRRAAERLTAAMVLASRGPEQLREVWSPLLQDPDETVRLAAARALVQTGDRAALPVLVALLNSADARVWVQSNGLLNAVSGNNAMMKIWRNANPRVHESIRENLVQTWGVWLMGEPPLVPEPRWGIDLNAFAAIVRLQSSGFNAGNRTDVWVNGRHLVGGGGDMKLKRGLALLAFDGDELVLANSYDTFASADDTAAFVQAIAALPEGTLVVVAARDDAATNFTPEGQAALNSVGGRIVLNDGNNVMVRAAYYCIGRKGLQPGQAIERIDPAGGPLLFPPSP